MNSQELKIHLLFHVLYRGGYLAAFTEYGARGVIGIADVYAMTESLLSHEFEVKVNKSDLAGELEAAKYWSGMKIDPDLFANKKPEKKIAKGTKHWHYLIDGGRQNWIVKPNRFSFAVPPSLEEFAMQGLKGTPYGLYVVSVHENGGHPWAEVVCRKRAEYLHKEKMTAENVLRLLRKGATEMQELRRKAFYQKYAIAESVSL